MDIDLDKQSSHGRRCLEPSAKHPFRRKQNAFTLHITRGSREIQNVLLLLPPQPASGHPVEGVPHLGYNRPSACVVLLPPPILYAWNVLGFAAMAALA